MRRLIDGAPDRMVHCANCNRLFPSVSAYEWMDNGDLIYWCHGVACKADAIACWKMIEDENG